MTLTRFLVLLSALTAAISCTREISEPVVPASAPEEASPGVILVEFSEELTSKVEADFTKGDFLATKSEPVNAALAEIGAVTVERLFGEGGEWEPRHRKSGLHRYYRIVYNSSVPETKATKAIESIEGVIKTERELEVVPNAVFNDPRLGEQWHYSNASFPGADVNCVPVWQKYTCGSSNVIVAVIDGGVDGTHNDLNGVVIPGGSNGSKNFVDNNYTIVAHRHGTHVAGTIGAINNNGIGGCGIAGGNDGTGGVRILSCQVFKTVNGSDKSGNMYGAIVWAADHGAVLANNSWSTKYDSAAKAAAGSAGFYETAIDYFINWAGCDNDGNQRPDSPMKGGLIFFSAGNENWPDGWPAEYAAVQTKCIAVGAFGPNGDKSYYSSYGDWVTLCAPGGDANLSSNTVLSTVPTNGYAWMQGTSMSCPHATGVAALVLSYWGGPGFTNSMLREKLLKGAKKTSNTINAKIGPKIDAYGALTYGMNTPPVAVGTVRSSSTFDSITLSWTVTADGQDGKATGYLALLSRNTSSLDNIDPKNIPEDVICVDEKVGDIALNKWIKATATGLEPSTKYYAVVIGYDKEGEYSDPSKKISVSTKAAPANPPVITSSYADDGTAGLNGVLNIDFSATDPDGDLADVTIVSGRECATLMALSAGSYRVCITGSKASAGRDSVTVKAADSGGRTAEKVFAYEILPNRAPVMKVTRESAASWLVSIYDPDGDDFGIDFTPGSPATSLSDTQDSLPGGPYSWRMTIDASSGVSGRFVARITATDVHGATATYAIPYSL